MARTAVRATILCIPKIRILQIPHIPPAKFAFTNYQKALSTLKFALRGGNFNQQKFLVEMETIDSMVIDFGVNQEKFEKKFKEKWGT